MLVPQCSPYVIFILTAPWFLAVFICESVDAFDLYPYYLPNCCESNGNASADGNSTSTDGGSIGLCRSQESKLLLLPKELFPKFSTGFELIEVELWNLKEEWKCAEGQENLDISIDFTDNESLRPGMADGKKGFAEVAFSMENFLDADGNIYNPRHFCVSSRMSDKTRLVIKTCKMCPCIPRCCGGHQSILTSSPTSRKESLLDFCSTPTPEKNSWNPWTSNILRVDNRTHFHQTIYAPHNEGDQVLWEPQEYCTLFRVKLEDELSLTLLEDGRLELTQENMTQVLAVQENFCIDGINGGDGRSSPGDKRNTPKDKEVVVVYVCSYPYREDPYWKETSKNIVRLPACSDLVLPADQLLQLPRSLFPNRKLGTKVAVAVRPTSGKSGRCVQSVECPGRHETFTLDFDGSTDNFFLHDRLFLGDYYYYPSEYCIRSVSHNALKLRVCREEQSFLRLLIVGLQLLVAASFYVAIAVVYILRKDKEPVFRCSIVASSISMSFTYVLFPTLNYLHLATSFKVIVKCIEMLICFFYAYGFSWMSVLCFDVWLTIAFIRPGRKSGKRLWGYAAFTFTIPTVFVGALVSKLFLYDRSIDFADQTAAFYVLDYLLMGSVIGLVCINFLLFLATAVKLWITQHSSDIKNQRKTLLMHFKLFLLVGLRCVSDFLLVFGVAEIGSQVLIFVAFFLLLLHPIVLFFVLVWDEEAKRYMETNYPRVKRVLNFIGGIICPVIKCWGLCSCKKPRNEGTSGTGAIEPPHCSTHMYVHTRRVPNDQ